MVTVRFYRRNDEGVLEWTDSFGPFRALRLRGDQLVVAELDPIAVLLVDQWVCRAGGYGDTRWDGCVMKSVWRNEEPSEN